MSKKLSVIIPVYNVENYLKKCIESLIQQDYDNYEVILVNDGSTDKSLEICEDYQKKYPEIIKVFSQKNNGQASARNYGFKKSNADYVFFIDSDDYIKTNCLGTLMSQVSNFDILVFNQFEVKGNKENFVRSFDNNIKDIRKKYILSTPGPCNKIISAKFLKSINFSFPEKMIYEDLAIIPSLGIYTDKIVFDESAYYYYVQRDGSTMNQNKYNKKLEDIFKAIGCLEKNFKNQYREEIEYITIMHLLKNASLRFLDFKKTDQLLKINKIIKEKFPKWRRNIYYKEYDIKRKIMCNLIMLKQYKLLEIIRNKGANK